VTKKNIFLLASVIRRERNIQRKEEEKRIKNAKYNFRYKKINDFEECPRYIKVRLGPLLISSRFS